MKPTDLPGLRLNLRTSRVAIIPLRGSVRFFEDAQRIVQRAGCSQRARRRTQRGWASTGVVVQADSNIRTSRRPTRRSGHSPACVMLFACDAVAGEDVAAMLSCFEDALIACHSCTFSACVSSSWLETSSDVVCVGERTHGLWPLCPEGAP